MSKLENPVDSCTPLPIRVSITCLLLSLASLTFASEYTLTGLTESGLYRVSLMPAEGEVPIAEIHNWIVRVENAEGDVFTPTGLGLRGGMPAHGHGMTVKPQVTRRMDDGSFLIEGMKFHMGGEWQLMVGVRGPKGPDQVSFDFEVAGSVVAVEASLRNWSAAEIAVMQSLTLSRLSVPKDPSNRFSGDAAAAELGSKLFFDQDMSATRTVSCATCHDPKLAFTDGRARSFGTAEVGRNAPTLIGVAHNSWFYWDGRRDSLWAQAITPPESPGEMDNNRVDVVRMVARKYADDYAAITGNALSSEVDKWPTNAGPFADKEGKAAWDGMPTSDRTAVNKAFANVGKILAAYMETLQPSASRFDHFVAMLVDDGYPAAREVLSDEEQRGLKLYLDGARTQCLRCHNGPLFTNFSFHNVATGVAENGNQDFGRAIGLQAALLDEFNCRGSYSDSPPASCNEIRFLGEAHADYGKFKVPTLRNVALTAPYMHDGRFLTLQSVLDFYTQTPDPNIGPHELPVLELSGEEIKQLASFLATLSDTPER